MDELTIGDKIYISSKRAAAITGYAKDYVGQLCREGHVEAKMVGRSWYVLESSIRAHRFGQTELSVQGTVIQPIKEEPRAMLQDTWESPKYIPEVAPAMPELIPETRVPEPYIAPLPVVETVSDESESLSEMQNAWKEWFEAKQEAVPEIREEPIPMPVEEPVEEPIKEEEVKVEEEEAIPVAVHRIEPVRPPTPIKMDIEPVQVPISRVRERAVPMKHPRRSRGGSNLVMVVSLLAFAGVVVAISYIGTGFGSAYMGTNPVIDYLGGASTIQK